MIRIKNIQQIGGAVVFNTDIVKMKISIKNAESIFKKALDTLKGDMPEAAEECGFCKWIQQNNHN